MQLDKFDNEILDLLEKNARLNFSQIGDIVHLSRTAVSNRVKAMEEAGEIVGYTTKRNPKLRTSFLLTITTTPDAYKSVLNAYKKEKWCELAMEAADNKLVVFCSLRSLKDVSMTYKTLSSGVKGIQKMEVLEIGRLEKSALSIF